MSAPFSLPSPQEVALATALPDWIKTHLNQYLTDPVAAHDWDASAAGVAGTVPTLLLLTRGRKSGKTLTLPLIYTEIDGEYIVIASKGGAPAHPAWFLNLDADPQCAIAVKDQFSQATARVLEGDVRTRAWATMVAVFAPYERYQSATKRLIPVVAIAPR
ncbi:MAG: nitroreductase/quinone reductase family protein [Pseudomonadota bacterium]